MASVFTYFFVIVFGAFVNHCIVRIHFSGNNPIRLTQILFDKFMKIIALACLLLQKYERKRCLTLDQPDNLY